MRITDYQALDPEAKFTTPRPAPQAPSDSGCTLKKSAPGLLREATSSRSLSPSPVWRRFFNNRARDEDRGRSSDRLSTSNSCHSESRSAASSKSRNRSISPESLRRFLSDVQPPRPDSNLSERPTLVIPEDIVEEIEDDDDNFASSAATESQPFATILSPPPFQRSVSCETAPLTIKNLSTLTLTTERPPSRRPTTQRTREESSPNGISLPESAHHPPHSENSATSSALTSPLSSSTPEHEPTSFYDDVDDDDEDHFETVSSNETDWCSSRRPSLLASKFSGYSLPRLVEENKSSFGTPVSPQLTDNEFVGALYPASGNLLRTPVDYGVGDFAAELGWEFDNIGSSNH